MYNGAKLKIKVDIKEKITERYPGEVKQGIYSFWSQNDLLPKKTENTLKSRPLLVFQQLKIKSAPSE